MTSYFSKTTSSRLAIIASLSLLASFLSLFPAAPFAAANGLGPGTFLDGACNIDDSTPSNHLTPETAFQIDTVDKLWEVTDCDSADSVVYFKILNDLDASSAVYAPTASPIGFSPSLVHSFSGVIDGGGFAVSASMSVTKAALFSYIHNATISNWVIQGSFVNPLAGSAIGAAGLAYQSAGHVDLVGLTSSATVTGSYYMGGFIGISSGTVSIENSTNTGSINGVLSAGGFVGSTTGAINISNSRNYGNVSVTLDNAGGFIGKSSAAVTITNSLNSAALINGKNYVGGLVGIASAGSNVQDSHNSGRIEGLYYSGGIIGDARGSVLISDSYNLGEISGNYWNGGIIGVTYNSATLTRTYNSGTISSTVTSVGGLVGRTKGTTNLNSSHNTALITGSQHAGGLFGYVEGVVNVLDSYNTGEVRSATIAGGLVGYITWNTPSTILNSYNVAPISSTDGYVGGLAGNSVAPLEIEASFNAGSVQGASGIGGLVGTVRSLQVTNSYNVGSVAGTGNWVGGLLGGSWRATLRFASSYNAGSVTGSSLVDGIVGFPDLSTVVASSAYSTAFSTYSDRAISSHGQSSDFYPGFDFDNIWGFAPCGQIQSFPLLRVFSQTTAFGSMGCAPTIAPNSLLGPEGYLVAEAAADLVVNQGSPQEQAPAPVATYEGPKLETVPATVVRGTSVEITGTKLESVNEVTIAEVAQEIISVTNTSVKFELAPETPAGVHDLVLRSDFGSLTLQGFIKVKPQISSQDQQVDAQGSLTTKTRLLSKNEDLNLAWMKDSLRKLNPEKVVCTATVAPSATQYQRVLARLKAKASCDQVLKSTPGAKIWIQAKATRTRFVDRILITSRP